MSVFIKNPLTNSLSFPISITQLNDYLRLSALEFVRMMVHSLASTTPQNKKAPHESLRILDPGGDGHICPITVEPEESSGWVKVLKPSASLFNSSLGYEDNSLYPGFPRMLLSNLEVPGVVYCLFMAPVPMKQGSVTVTVPVAV